MANKIKVLFFSSRLGGGGAEMHLVRVINIPDFEQFEELREPLCCQLQVLRGKLHCQRALSSGMLHGIKGIIFMCLKVCTHFIRI